MSRQASIAVGGYYPLPIHLVPRIASLIGIPVAGRYAFMDPCAGEGDAIRVLIDQMFPRPLMHITRGLAPPDVGPMAYLIEMEETRRRELHAKFHGAWYGPINVYEGDAFRARWTPSSKRPGVSCLYLNPPYDTHLRYKRMEEKFLRRFTSALAPGGVLVFVVPYHALKASAETLARHYQNVFCYRFPDPDWDTFKQVVLFANRLPTELMDPDPTTQARVEFWAANPDEIPVLEDRPGRVAVSLPLPLGQSHGNRFQEFMHGLEDLAILPMDTMAVLEHYLPWGVTDRRGRTALTPGVFVDPLSDDLTVRIYPTLMPPRPAHIAAGIASGVFNGERVVPDDPTSTAPALLVKGVFDREFETVEEKKDRDGMVTGEVQVQQPRLVVTVLDLSTSKVHVLKSSVDITGSVDPATMTTGDLLVLYSRSLLQVLKDHCPVTYDPTDPSQAFDLAPLARPLYTAQAHAVRAMVLDLGGRDVPLRRRAGRDTVLLGEIGSGKSSMAFSTALSCGATKILVMCPPHLLDSWRDEIRLLRPDATVMVLADVQGVEEFSRMDPSHITVALLSRETAKLGHGYVGVGSTCPRCGTHLTTDAETQARTRLRCDHTYRRAANAAADLLERSCVLALPYFPKNPVIVRLAAQRLSSRTMARAVPAYTAHRQKDGADLPFSPEEVEHLRSQPWVRALWQQVLVLMGESLTGWLQEDNALWRVLRSLVAFYHDDALTAEIAEMCFVGATLDRSHLYYGSHPFHTIALTLVRYLTPGSALQEQILARFTDWTQFVKGVTRDDIYATRRSITLLKGTYTGMGHINLTSVDGVLSYQSFAMGSPSHLSGALEVLYQAGTWYHAGAKCGEPLYQAVPDPRRFPLATFISRHYPNLFDFLVVDECFPGETLIRTETGPRPIQDVRVGDRVWSRTDDGRMVLRRVLRKWVKKPTKGLVRVTHEHGYVECTPEHRFWTPEGYVPARDLMDIGSMGLIKHETDQTVSTVWGRLFVHTATAKGAEVLPQAMCGSSSHQTFTGTLSPVWESGTACAGKEETGLLFSQMLGSQHPPPTTRTPQPGNSTEALPCGQGEVSQTRVSFVGFEPHAAHERGSLRSSQDDCVIEGSYLHTPGWERSVHPRANCPAPANIMANGGVHPDWQPEMEIRHGGPGSPDSEDRCGMRWCLAPHTEAAQQGSDEGDPARSDGVGGTTILEFRGDIGSGECGVRPPSSRGSRVRDVSRVDRQDVEWVYDLEVEETHCYFAGGILVHNCHEVGTDGSAQERAAHRLSGLRKPTVLMTGSLMNGYARSLFANWWALFPKFREAFGREDQRRFVDRFGYRKRLIQDVDRDTGKIQEFGSRTDRVDRKEKDLGDAPGLLPLFILEYLLPHAATIQKADLALELPPCRDIPIRVKATQEQMGRHMGMLRDLLDQVKADVFTDLMGKLWGQVAESPSQLDRATADVGGGEGGSYEVRYPESVGAGLVHRVEPFSADNVMPKEQWVMDLLANTEFPEGRNVIVFTWHTELLPRMQRLLQARFGFKAPILDPAKVPTGKRQAWITTNVVNKRARVLLANPVCVQTGLNNLVYFSSEVWMENPACNPFIFRQARGRVDRIGQKAPETRIYFPIYDSVGPNKLHSLLLHKVGVSMATDGLDAESALQAAGVGETGAGSSFSVGKELYRIMQEMWGT